jgi:cobalt/nickel transport system permease protein
MSAFHFHGRMFEVHPLDEHASTSRLGKLDARAKLVGVLAFVVVSALLTKLELVFASLMVAVAFAAASAVPARHIFVLYLGALPFILLASLSLFLFIGFENGVAMWARVSACVLALIVLASATETFELFSGLRRLHVPAIITTLLMLTHKYIALLTGELSRMTVARRARGFRGGKNLLDRYALKVISYTAGMVLVRSSERADRAYEGLKARGYEKDMVGWRANRMAAREVLFMVSLLATSAVLLAFQMGVVG